MPRALVWSIADRFNAGRPDLCVINGQHTTWFELKVGKKYGVTALQWEILKRIERGYLVEMLSTGYKLTNASTAQITFFDHSDFLIIALDKICST